MQINMERDYLRVNEAMKAMGWKRDSFYRVIKTGVFLERGAIAKRGRNTYISKSAIEKYNQQQETDLYGKS